MIIKTEDGSLTLSHPLYEETYHSKQGARFEADSLYMSASKFREALAIAHSLVVLDVGLGLGYNALMTIECWMQSEGSSYLHLISLEQSSELVQTLTSSDCPWKEGWSDKWRQWSLSLHEVGPDRRQANFTHPQSGQILHWELQIGDARQATLPDHSLDFIWQDAFSPQKNPELWTPEWFSKLRQASRPAVCLVSYSVARIVRDHLQTAGWQVQRVKTPAPLNSQIPIKKQWLLASLPSTINTI